MIDVYDGPKADVSVEIGHFYADAFAEGTDALSKRFEPVRIWSEALVGAGENASNSFMFDDYHNRPDRAVTPRQIFNQLIEATDAADLRLDYIGREAACVGQAPTMLEQISVRNGYREANNQGWLISDRGVPGINTTMAMQDTVEPRQKHTTYVDVEIFDYKDTSNHTKSWACPYLASIWNAIRLGRLRDPAFESPYLLGSEVPDWERWEDVPPLVQVNPDAEPFHGRRLVSILPSGFLAVESAVDLILNQLEWVESAEPRIQRALAG